MLLVLFLGNITVFSCDDPVFDDFTVKMRCHGCPFRRSVNR